MFEKIWTNFIIFFLGKNGKIGIFQSFLNTILYSLCFSHPEAATFIIRKVFSAEKLAAKGTYSFIAVTHFKYLSSTAEQSSLKTDYT